MGSKLAKVTSKGQTTVPRDVRDALQIVPGDILRFEVEGDHAIVSKVSADDDAYLKGLESTLGEWTTETDEDAYRDL